MATRLSRSFVFSSLLLLASPVCVLADYVSVRDCIGSPRAMQEVEANSSNTVTIGVVDKMGKPASNVTYSLKSGQKTYSSTVTEGAAQFEGVTSGDWQLCLKDGQADSYTLSKVSIAAEKDSSMRTAGIIGGIAAVGGAVAIAIGSSSDDGGSDGSAAVAPPASGGGGGSGGGGAGGSGTGSSGASRPPSGGGSSGGHGGGINAAVDDCLEDEAPAPLSPIS